MIKMPDTKSKFFSVRYSVTIQGTRYVPSVCYPLTSSLQAAVEEMAAKDMAKVYLEKVRFVTGVPYPAGKHETGAARASSVPAPEVKADSAVKQTGKKLPAAPEKPGRKSRRSAYASQAGREFD
jgi:hypothetical protein